MTYSIQHMVESIATMLSGQFSSIPVYASPNQQGTEYPCFFVFLMPSEFTDEIDSIGKRSLSFDVVYVQERNIANAYEDIHGVADTLDELFDMVQYSDFVPDETTKQPVFVPLHTHERAYSIEDQELHYKFRVSQRVSTPVEHNYMKTEETNVEIKRD